MLIAFASSWWALVLRGVIAVLFGVLAFLWPGITLTALIYLFGAFALIYGAFAIVGGIRAPKGFKRWWLMIIEGCLSIVAGVLAFVVPGITAFFLLILIAAWAIVVGAFEIAAAIQLRKQIKGEWLLALAGIASILFGGLLLVDPLIGALAVVWIIGAYAIAFGVLLIALGFKLRGLDRSLEEMTPRMA